MAELPGEASPDEDNAPNGPARVRGACTGARCHGRLFGSGWRQRGSAGYRSVSPNAVCPGAARTNRNPLGGSGGRCHLQRQGPGGVGPDKAGRRGVPARNGTNPVGARRSRIPAAKYRSHGQPDAHRPAGRRRASRGPAGSGLRRRPSAKWHRGSNRLDRPGGWALFRGFACLEPRWRPAGHLARSCGLGGHGM